MDMRNYTPFPNLRFYNSDNAGRQFGIVLVKGTYILRNGLLEIAAEQAPVLFEDEYHGDIASTSLWMPSDVVSKKPRTDVILNAIARPPTGVAAREWTCGIRIEGGRYPFARRLKVCGPRNFEPKWHVPDKALGSLNAKQRQRAFAGWFLQEPSATFEVPIRYELAYGGSMASASDTPTNDACEYNPVGCGWIDETTAPRENRPVPAPQIAAIHHGPIPVGHDTIPAGFGPIPPGWLPRRTLGGTFDKDWQTNVWPNWPADYDFAYNNSAHPDLVYPGYLRGDEIFVLDGLSHAGEVSIQLPDQAVSIGLVAEPPSVVRLDLDTVLMDVADTDPNEHRYFLSWRATFDLANSVDAIVIMMHTCAETAAVKPGAQDYRSKRLRDPRPNLGTFWS